MKFLAQSVIGLFVLVAPLVVDSNHFTEPLNDRACPKTARKCEFFITAALRYTMVFSEETTAGPKWVPVEAREDGLYTTGAPGDCEGNGRKLSDREAQTVIIGDGTRRPVFAVNDSVPGPTIVVHEGQELIIHFTNHLENEAATLHMHGIHQRGTPWMDGAGGVSHCPINPGETFTYRMRAEPSGTFWYHAHHGSEFSMGLHGALIVIDNGNSLNQLNANRDTDPSIPWIDNQYALVVQDWMAVSTVEASTMYGYDAETYTRGFSSKSTECSPPTYLPDGTTHSPFPFYSATINGKGRHYEVNDYGEHIYTNPFTPLEFFQVRQGQNYYFRVISAAFTFPFAISIDGHPLHVVASDGYHFRTEVVDYLIITSGERYDFWIEATNPGGLNRFWLRAETLEQKNGNQRRNHVNAIISYDYSRVDPVSQKKKCTYKNRCKALNCPYKILSESYHTDCVNFDQLRTPWNPAYRQSRALVDNQDHNETTSLQHDVNVVTHYEYYSDNTYDVFEQFLDLHYGTPTNGKGSSPMINGIKHVGTPYPPQVFEKMSPWVSDKCDYDQPCEMSHVIKIPLHKTVYFIVSSQIRESNPSSNPHPIHIHGYTPQVVEVGYPTYNADGTIKSSNPDITCGNRACRFSNARKASLARHANHVYPLLARKDAPYKDTIIVPTGGYVVLRFKADNPGFWFMHCHIEYHALHGMGLVVQAGEPRDMSRAPPRMARCGHFSLSDSEYTQAENNFYMINGDVTPEAENVDVVAENIDVVAENIDVVAENIDTSPGEIETSNRTRSRRSVAEVQSSDLSVHYGYQVATWVLAVACLGLGLALVVFAMRRKELDSLKNNFGIDS